MNRSSAARACLALLVLLLAAGCAPAAAPPAAAPKAGSAAPAPAAAAAPPAAPTAPPAPTKLVVAYGSITATQMPVWVAKEIGAFEKYGIDADVTYIDGSAGVRALATGDAPVSSVGGAIVPSKLSGADVAVIADLASRLLYGVYANPEITSVEGLRGRTIVTTTPGSTNYQGVALFLKRFGLEAGRDVNLLTSPGGAEQLALLRQGLADAALFTPPSSIRAREQGLHELLSLAEANITFLTSVIAVYRPFAAQNPEVVRNFLRGYGEGLRVSHADPATAKAALAKYARLEDPAALDESYTFNSVAWPRGAPYPTLPQLQTVLDLQETPEARTAKPEDFVDPRFVRELDEQGFFRQIGLVQ
jgi:ABC-type nitrate/sulfonate/bicarbonate transport system substrate-binding protein